MTDAEMDALFEASRDDGHRVVGSEVRALVMALAEARAALKDGT